MRRREIVLSICIVASAILSIAIWSESRGTSILTGVTEDRARRIAKKENAEMRQVFEAEMNDVRGAFSHTAIYAAGAAALSFAALMIVWLPRHRDIVGEATDPDEHATADKAEQRSR